MRNVLLCVYFFDLRVVYRRVYSEAVEKRAGALQLDWAGLPREAQILSKLCPSPPPPPPVCAGEGDRSRVWTERYRQRRLSRERAGILSQQTHQPAVPPGCGTYRLLFNVLAT